MITVSSLGRNYKVAQRGGSIFQFIFKRKYNTIHAVSAVSFTIAPGEMVGFVGPNGAGKSTTIKMLCGILAPTSGSVTVLGKDPFSNRKKNAYHIGVLFGQRSQLWWDLPVRDSLKLLKQMYKVSDVAYAENYALFQEYLDIESIQDQPVRQLSLGQRMRAEVAAAVLHNPKILFLDEPTIGLDITVKRKIREFIRELNRRYQTTVILTSHDMKDIEDICERIIVIDKGTIVVDTKMDQLQKRYSKNAVVTLTIREPVENIAIDGATLKEQSEHKLVFEIEKNVLTPGQLMHRVSEIVDVEDIDIKENSVEDIIHDIYLSL